MHPIILFTLLLISICYYMHLEYNEYKLDLELVKSHIAIMIRPAIIDALWQSKGTIRLEKTLIVNAIFNEVRSSIISVGYTRTRVHYNKFFDKYEDEIKNEISNSLITCNEFIKDDDGVLLFKIYQYN